MLRKNTQLYRRTLSKVMSMPDGHVLVGPERGAPPGSYRCVKVGTPESPTVAAAIDLDPKATHYNRDWHWPELPTGKFTEFKLLPNQTLSAMTMADDGGMAEVTVIVEYY